MIRGETVTVIRPVDGAEDRFGNATVASTTSETVDNVLVAPGGTSDLDEARPDGADVTLALHFPKSYTSSLRGCSVVLTATRAGTYRVVGDPQPYMDANTPTAWNREVEAVAVYG